MLFKADKKSQKEYERLGKRVHQIMVDEYLYTKPNLRRFFVLNFVRGLIAGLGGVIGATLVLAILLWLLGLFGKVPLIGEFFKDTIDTLKP